MPERLSIIFAASEVEGFSKSGGLADVARALPLHLKSMGHDVRIVTPLYRLIPENHKTETIIPALGVPLGSEESWCAVRQLEMEGVVEGKMISVPVYFIENTITTFSEVDITMTVCTNILTMLHGLVFSQKQFCSFAGHWNGFRKFFMQTTGTQLFCRFI